ncbi:MAG: hypothetical protein K6L81_01165 [Agarilytica sp.]
MNLQKILCGISFALLSSLSVVADEGRAGVEALPSELRALIKSEMNSLDKGFKSLFTAYYSGDTQEVVAIAKEIQASFVLKQALSQAQKKTLHAVLPADFLHKDKEFHYFAGMLAHTAEMGKDELVGFYFSKLADACTQCHAKHATHRFNFSQNTKVKDHHH